MVRLRSGSSTDGVEPSIRRRSTPATRDHDDNAGPTTSMDSLSSSESTIVVDTSARAPAQAPLVTFHHDNDANSVTSDVEIASQSEGSTIVNTSFRISPEAPPMASFAITHRPIPSAAGTQTATNTGQNELSRAPHTTANEAIDAFNASATAPGIIYDTNYHNPGAVNPNAPNTRRYWIWEVLHAAHLRLPDLDFDRPDPTDSPMADSDPTLPVFPSDSDDDSDDEDRLTPIYVTPAPTTNQDNHNNPPTAPDGTREFFVDVIFDPIAAHPWGAVLCVGRLPAAAAEDPDQPGELVETIDVGALVDVRRLGWLQTIGDTDASACLWLWRRVVNWAEENAEGGGAGEA